jgi:tetratricopeptide (TPR) repeat protein
MRLGERESGTSHLEEAVAAYREALKERTRDRVPLDWALTQNNLGIALTNLGERVAETALLEEALASYNQALDVLTAESAPHYRSMALSGLERASKLLDARKS